MSFSIREGYLHGCIGRITEMHARYYANLVGFGLQFEAIVATELAQFCAQYEEGRDGLWLAVAEGGIHGSIAIDGSRTQDQGAHLRWFIADDAIRGLGLGSQMLTQAVEFCRARGYRRVYLWTFEGLDAARHLYEKQGFCLASQERGTRWGAEVNEQRFDLKL